MKVPKRVTLNIKGYWPEGLSLESAAEEMKTLGMPLNRLSLGSIRRGGTERGDYLTPFKLAAYLSHKTGKKITAMDLLEVES